MKAKSKFLNCFGPLAHEETILFNRKEAWNSEDALDEKYIEYLMPSSTRYFSRLRPLFSFEVKSLSSLNNFSHILFRDGILFLLRFFIRFKEPTGLRSKILIHQDLASIVPKAWEDSVLFYKLVKREENRDTPSEVIIHISPESYENREALAEEMAEVKKAYDESIQFNILITLNGLRGEDYLDYCRHDSFSAIEAIKETLGQRSNSILRLESFWSKNFRGVELYECKGSRVFTMDSFMGHHVLAKGGSVSGVHLFKGDGQQVHLSPYHSMEITEGHLNENNPLRHFLYGELSYPNSTLFSNEPADIRGVDDYFKVFYYSKDLLRMARYLNLRLIK